MPKQTKSKSPDRIARIVTAAEQHFGQKVVSVATPGGKNRASCRLHFPDKSVIATLRPNFRRAHLEAFVLHNVAAYCDDTPKALGVVGEIIFQSDLGGRRLNREIANLARHRRVEVAADAVAAIFRVQEAGRKAGLQDSLPHLGINEHWIGNFTDAIEALEPFSEGKSKSVSVHDLREMINVPAKQFVKWDCRSGNATIGEDERVRWFDFEYSGVRHGAEDLAWLIGDEAWPIGPETMEDIVRQCFDPACGHTLDAYLDYLSVYVTLHCVQRFKLIIKETKKRGWLSKTRVRKYDDAGVHPEFAAHICNVAAYFADRKSITRPIGRDFEATCKVFLNIVKNAA